MDNPPQRRDSSRSDGRYHGQPTRTIIASNLFAFLLLMALWIIFSGRLDAFHLILGAVSCTLVTAISGDLLFTSTKPQAIIRTGLRLLGYLPWLCYQIFLANLHVMVLVFHPRMMERINPKIIQFDSQLTSDAARMLFANSITLTPGTITVEVTALGRFAVHCIDDPSGAPLPGKMETKIAHIFET